MSKRFLLILFWAAGIQATVPTRPSMAQSSLDPCLAKTRAERLGKGCISYDTLVRVIPGFADLTRNGNRACQWTAYLIDPVTNGELARTILAPIVHPMPEDEECLSFTGIRVKPARYSWLRLVSIRDRASEIIDKAAFASDNKGRSFAVIEDARIVIKAHNRRALKKLRTMMNRDPIVRKAVPIFGMLEGPEELDPPITPPREAYLLVLDSVAARYANTDTVAFIVTHLPNGVTVKDIVGRSLRLWSPNDRPCSKWKIWFGGARKWADGRIEISVSEGDWEKLYSVWCTTAGCKMPYGPMPGGDYMTRVC